MDRRKFLKNSGFGAIGALVAVLAGNSPAEAEKETTTDPKMIIEGDLLVRGKIVQEAPSPKVKGRNAGFIFHDNERDYIDSKDVNISWEPTPCVFELTSGRTIFS